MRVVRLCRLGLAAAIAVLAICGALSPAGAQDRAKIEVVSSIPHSDRVTSVAFSPDGARVLSGSYDKSLRLWDAATGALLRTFQGHAGFSDEVLEVAFSRRRPRSVGQKEGAGQRHVLRRDGHDAPRRQGHQARDRR
jgi:hypothetical protein